MTTSSDSKILLTGAGGFLGQGFLASLDAKTAANVLCITRSTNDSLAKSCGQVVEGFFGNTETLRALDSVNIGAVVHLAAVTGGCSEADGAAVNVEGTRVLMRYLIDRGCKRFVLAGSIAATGFQRPDFRPVSLPMDDEHPCFDRDGYGFSKYMMEEQVRYFCRQNEDISVACLRFGSIVPPDAQPKPLQPAPPPQWTYGHFTPVALKDAVRAIHLSLQKPEWRGLRIMNIVARRANLAVPMEKLVQAWHPAWKPDLSHYQRPGHEFDSAFATERAEKELGFVADWPPA